MGNWISKHCWNVLGTFSGKWGRNVRSQTTELDEALKAGLFWVLLSLQSPPLSEKKLYTHTYFKLSNTAFNSGVTLQVRILSPMCSQSSVKSLGRGRGRSCNSVKPSTKEFRKDLLICRLWFEKGKKGRWNNKTCSLGGKWNSLFIRNK